MDDSVLLRQFVMDRSETALAGLVGRYVDLVYSAARRQVKDATLAEDVTQAVFILLAEKARTIRDGEALAGWLLVTTRFVALNTIRSEARRRKHEHEAAAMKRDMQSDEQLAWEAIGPMLDQGIARLKREDRDALAMRYFQGQSVAEVAVSMGISQDAAQKRVSRAVQRLRDFFSDHGITTSPEGLASALTTNAVMIAPAMLSARISTAAMTKAAVSGSSFGGSSLGGSSFTVGKGAAIFMATAKAKLIGAGVAAALLIGVTGTIAYQQLVGPGQKTRQITVATAPTVTGNDVHARMRSVYALGEGEVVKRVQPPFIDDRMEWYRQTAGESQVNAIPKGPDVIIFTDDGTNLRYRGMMFSGGGGGSVVYAVESVLGVESYNMVLPQRTQNRKFDGDWVLRERSTTAQRAEGLSKLLTGALGQAGRLVEKPMERNVIVVSGTYAYTSLPELAATNRTGPNPILIFHGKFDENTQRSAGTTDVGGMLKGQIGQMLGMPVVIDANLAGAEMVNYRNSVPWTGGRRTEAQQKADMDEVLANLSKQTGLTFTRAKRVVPTWVWENTAP